MQTRFQVSKFRRVWSPSLGKVSSKRQRRQLQSKVRMRFVSAFGTRTKRERSMSGLSGHSDIDQHRGYLCTECGRRYKDNWYLKQHISRVHERRKLNACNLCDDSFFDREELETHLRRAHTGEKPFACKHPNCPRVYHSRGQLRTNALSHKDVHPHSCTYCDKSFPNRTRLAIHNRVHTGERPFSCEQCGKCFRYLGHFNIHMKRHTGERPYSCSCCSYKTGIKSYLTVHMRVHTGEKPYQCTECGRSFAAKGNLNAHIAAQHSCNKPQHVCNYCQKTIASAYALRQHIRRQHESDKEQQITCGICDEVFDSTANLRQHKKVHPVNKPFSCNFCEKCFAGNLMEHIKRHTGEKPLSCAVCGKEFLKSSHLKRHENIHQTRRVKQFHCQWCTKSYHNQAHLRRHAAECKGRPDPEYRKTVNLAVQRNRKSGEHEFMCDTCANPLSSKNALKRHRIRIHGTNQEQEGRYNCKNCDMRYFDECELKRHERVSKRCIREQTTRMTRDKDGRVSASKTTFAELRVVLQRLPSHSHLCT